jgi:hypothetical protein
MNSLLDHAKQQLRTLAQVCNFSRTDVERAIDVCQVLCASYGDRNALDTPRWSGLTDDCSPFEFSIAIGNNRRPELRMVSEAQKDPPSPEKYWEAGKQLCKELSRRYSASVECLERVIDLFHPSDHVYFSMLHGVVFRPGSSPLFKVYLNPKAKGKNRTREIVRSAVDKLGHMDAWLQVASSMREHDELQFFSLDLDSSDQARSKIYLRHRFCTPADLEHALAVVNDSIPGDATTFSRALLGRVAVLPRPALTMYTFIPGRGLPKQPAIHLAVFPYGGSDAAMRDRISSLLTGYGLPTKTYLRCLDALAVRPLQDEIGIHNYVSFQRQNGMPRITVYLSPRIYLYRLGAIGFDPKIAWPTPIG